MSSDRPSRGPSIRVRDLRKTGQFVIETGVGGWTYNYIVRKTTGGISKRVHGFSEMDDLGTSACPGISVKWNAKRNRITAQLPIACTGTRARNESEIGVFGIDFSKAGKRDRVGVQVDDSHPVRALARGPEGGTNPPRMRT